MSATPENPTAQRQAQLDADFEQRQAHAMAMGGSRKVEDRRREALRQWLPMLLERINRAGDRGLSVQQASRATAAVPGFQQAL